MSTENTETVISINHVSKVYKLFEKPMDRLKESLSLTHKNYHTDHFALEDISLEVHKGECVGIIGTNGSGKSTMALVLSGIASPDEGEIIVNGEQALVAINTGLNKQLTGLENIELKGALLGLSKKKSAGNCRWSN